MLCTSLSARAFARASRSGAGRVLDLDFIKGAFCNNATSAAASREIVLWLTLNDRFRAICYRPNPSPLL
jgi:hypothetical protein